MSRLAELAELAYMARYGSPYAWDEWRELNDVDRLLFIAVYMLDERAMKVLAEMG